MDLYPGSEMVVGEEAWLFEPQAKKAVLKLLFA